MNLIASIAIFFTTFTSFFLIVLKVSLKKDSLETPILISIVINIILATFFVFFNYSWFSVFCLVIWIFNFILRVSLL